MENDELLEVLRSGIPAKEKYSETVREFCLSLNYYYFDNHLPHAKTLQRWMANSDVNGKPGIQNEHIEKLKRIAENFEALNKTKMVCSLVFDEISLRKQMYWSWHQSEYVGFEDQIDGDPQTAENMKNSNTDTKRAIARQAITFILNGTNCHFEFPVAYFLIHKLNSLQRKHLVNEIITFVTQCNIHIGNLTFDGHPSNLSMCNLFDANIDVSSSSQLKTYILNPVNGEKIYLIFDPCHMEKLVRNTLAIKKIFYDDKNEKVEFKYFERLYEFSKKNDFHTHKLSKRHMQWRRNMMSVRVAVETFSESVASSMQFLMEQKHPEFINAGPTIRSV